MMQPATLCCLLAALVALAGASKTVQILDSSDQVDLETVAKNMCWKNSGSHKQLAKLATVGHLRQYLESLPAEHLLASCANRNLGLLRQLEALLTTSNQDVCSPAKLDLLEAFHHNYLSSQRRAQLVEAPKLIKSFFMHYASQVSELCARQSEQFFLFAADSPVELPKVDQLLEQYRRTVGTKDQLDSYNDLFFVWGVMDSVPKGMHGKVADYVVSGGAGSSRMSLRSDKAQGLLAIQQVCREQVRPVYARTLLPALKLIDLGYYPSSASGLLDQLNQNPFLNRLYKLALLCETSLPVRVEHSAGEQRTVLMKPGEEELNNSEAANEKVVPVEPVVWQLERLPTVTESGARAHTKKVAADLRQRRRHLWRVIKRVVKGGSRKAAAAQEQQVVLAGSEHESFEESVRDLVERVDEVELAEASSPSGGDDDVDADEDPQLSFPTRRRRDLSRVGRAIVKMLVTVSRISVIVIIFVIKLIVALLSGLALFLATLIGLDEVKVELSDQLGKMDFSMKIQ